MKKLSLHVPVDEKGRAMSVSAQIGEKKKKINEMIDKFDLLIKYIKQKEEFGSILQILNWEEEEEEKNGL